MNMGNLNIKFFLAIINIIFIGALAQSRVISQKNSYDLIADLFKYISLGDTKKVQKVIDEGVDINAPDYSSDTPLQCAVQHKRLNIVKILAEHGASINYANDHGQTPLIIAAITNRIDIANYLIFHGARIDDRDDAKATALLYATSIGFTSYNPMINLLLRKGANPNSNSTTGQTPLISSSWHGNIYAVRSLIQHGAKVDLQDNDGETPLIAAAEYDRVNVIKYLVNEKADINLPNYEGRTALISAARYGSFNASKVLIILGANINARDKYNRTAFFYAISNKYRRIADFLKKNGAN